MQALSVHAAPRALQFSGAISDTIVPGRSILAGCAQSIPLTRAYLATEFDKVIVGGEGICQAVLVDDVAHVISDSGGRTAEVALILAERCVRAAKRLKLQISLDKSVA